MSYIGNEPPDIGAYGVQSFDGGGTTFTLSKPSTTATVLLFIDGVRQTPVDAYSVSGVTLTTTATTPSGTDNVTVQFLGDVVDFGEPSDDSVTSAKIVDGAIVNADVNASAAIAVSKLNISGSATSANYLRGDSSWQPLTEYDDSGLQDVIALLGFKVASNGSLAKYNLVDQTIDDFQDASGVDASASTNEVRDSSGKYYSGAVGGDATGGTITYSGGNTIHTFPTGSTNFVVPDSGNVNWLVVAGGGGGGYDAAAGGGAGGFRAGANHAVTAQTYSVVVGAGGAGSSSGAANGADGADSSFDTVTSTGGGGGGTGGTGYIGNAGGSGGGRRMRSSGVGGAGNTPSITPITGETTTVQGYIGGGHDGTGGANNTSGGGGGSSGAGVAGTENQTSGTAGNGGAPTSSSISGSAVTYAGGGGGSGEGTGRAGYGGGTSVSADKGGGGDGGYGGAAGGNGVDGTGGGGGGGGGSPGDGGDGVAIIAYTTGEFASYNNMTLVSTSTTAEAAPTKGDIVLTYTNGAGSTTLGTDLTAEFSADNGSTWTAMTLGSEGSTGSHNIATAHDVSLTSTSGTSMRYRIKTLNQSASKSTRIQAVSLGWS